MKENNINHINAKIDWNKYFGPVPVLTVIACLAILSYLIVFVFCVAKIWGKL